MDARAILAHLLTKTAAKLPEIHPPRVGGHSLGGTIAQTLAGGALGGTIAGESGGDANEIGASTLFGGLLGNHHFRGMLNANELKGQGGARAAAMSKRWGTNILSKGGLLAALSVARHAPSVMQHLDNTTGNLDRATAGAEGSGSIVKDMLGRLTGAAGNAEKVTGNANQLVDQAKGVVDQTGNAVKQIGDAAGGVSTGLNRIGDAASGIEKGVGQLGTAAAAGAAGIGATADQLAGARGDAAHAGNWLGGLADRAGAKMHDFGQMAGKAAPYAAAGVGGLALAYLLQKELASRRAAKNPRHESIIRHLSGAGALAPVPAIQDG